MKRENTHAILRLLLPAIVLAAASTLQADMFVLTVYENAAGLSARTDPTRASDYWQRFAAFGRELQEAGLTAAAAHSRPPPPKK